MDPLITATQEPLFNDTTFRYELTANAFRAFEKEKILIREEEAVRLVATLGVKGPNFLSCDPAQFTGDNILSVVYAPSADGDTSSTINVWVAWEDSDRSGTGKPSAGWRPAACNAYIGLSLW